MAFAGPVFYYCALGFSSIISINQITNEKQKGLKGYFTSIGLKVYPIQSIRHNRKSEYKLSYSNSNTAPFPPFHFVSRIQQE